MQRYRITKRDRLRRKAPSGESEVSIRYARSNNSKGIRRQPTIAGSRTRLRSPGPELRLVNFCFVAPGASSVCVAGNFNDWNPHANPLRQMVSGRWVLQMLLPPGRYEYRFLVDDQWKPDPAATHHVSNFCGVLNSLLFVD